MALAAWFGAIVLISFVVAPTVFRNMPREAAGEVMGKVFAGYYTLVVALGVLALVAFVCLALRTGWGRERWISLALISAMLGAALYVREVLMPALLTVRAAIWQAPGSDQVGVLRTQLEGYHHMSVNLNGAMLFMAIALIALQARRENRFEGSA